MNGGCILKSFKFKKIKSISKKFTSFLLTFVICLAALTVNGMLVIAEATEYCDPSLGAVTESVANGKTILTVNPNENVGFRAWYYDGKEVGMDKTITVTSSEASKY